MLKLFLILILIGYCYCFIDNYVIGTPKVICAENDVALDVITSKPFEGNIFVKGRAKDSPCRQSYSANGTNSYSLPLGKCGMQKLRSASPRGISFSVTVIVSFHPAGFITKNDRAFHIKCFYMEPDEIVTSGIEVSQIPTTELSDTMSMPTCEYSVRTGSPTGPRSTFANVGDSVYHVWECKGNDMGMLIKKCFVSDGDGEDHPVVDETGCTSDKYLLTDIEYDSTLMKAHAVSQVFKYADSNQLFFTCQIRLCQKQMGMCDDVTPPKCSEKALNVDSNTNETEVSTSRPKRQLTLNTSYKLPVRARDIEIDVASPEMLILDKDEKKQLSNTEMCINKIFLPIIPLIILTIVCLSSSLTLLCAKKYFKISKFVEY